MLHFKKQNIESNFFTLLFYFLLISSLFRINSLISNMCVYAQLCLTLGDLMDCSLPGSSTHGIFQTRILEQVAIS